MRAFTAVVVGLAMMVMAASAQASLVTLTDTSALDTSMANPDGTITGGFAIHFDSTADVSVKGLNFQNDNRMSSGAYTFANANTGPGHLYGGNSGRCAAVTGTDGAAMNTVLNDMVFSWAGGYQSYTFANQFVVGQTYNVQFICTVPGAQWGDIDVNFDILDASLNANAHEANLVSNGVNGFIISETFTATSTDETFKLSTNAGYGEAAGIVVNPVPEPATMSLLALGGLGALIRRRK